MEERTSASRINAMASGPVSEFPLLHLAGRLYGTPLLIRPREALIASGVLLNAISAKSGGAMQSSRGGEELQAFPMVERADGSASLFTPRSSGFVGRYRIDENGRPSPYRVTDSGVAIIEVIGDLVNRGAWLGTSCGLVSYEGLIHQFQSAKNDPTITGVLVDFESPGGEAIGMTAAATALRELAAVKPVISVLNGMAASAAYGIASGSTLIVIGPDAIGGSIGVVMMHLDFSEYLRKQGVKPTLIHIGAHKVDGNPYEPLPDEVRADFETEASHFYDMFVATVSSGRGLDAKAIRATEARVYVGQKAIDVGLADQIGTFDDALARLEKPQSRASRAQGRTAARVVSSAPKQTAKTPAKPGLSAAMAELLESLN
jgi:signal peptide peptidase SppA